MKKVYESKSSLIVYLVLRFLVILVGVRSIFRHDYESLFLCVLTLSLLILPSFLERRLKVEIPSTFEIIILCFIFSAEILGEIHNFYIIVPHWDTILHTLNGFNCAAIGFALVDLLNRSEQFSFRLSPLFLALVAFCFSMTVGVCWEFIEYGVDTFTEGDMQKDFVVDHFASVTLDETRQNIPIVVSDISDVIVVHGDGSQEALGVGGYLDIGINDTMKDLFVNLIGAVVFSIIGFFYVKKKGEGKFASKFIPKVKAES
ncbi:MAG: hypothetical protein IJ899_12250 [Blautia sp.]|nr:hypothetical protein [Blautia sp.]